MSGTNIPDEARERLKARKRRYIVCNLRVYQLAFSIANFPQVIREAFRKARTSGSWQRSRTALHHDRRDVALSRRTRSRRPPHAPSSSVGPCGTPKSCNKKGEGRESLPRLFISTAVLPNSMVYKPPDDSTGHH
ncbi:hypothetical protein J437_LFUL015009 [Ladona fulva]|uniref:Uncharacterized protein n=1 Tax=Ladona fulva TaxID=123851 RepID=A0A8K0KHE3_LADFU|nr:hypothetical protein J437_LFUL015009 [Ladona fulva]